MTSPWGTILPPLGYELAYDPGPPEPADPDKCLHRVLVRGPRDKDWTCYDCRVHVPDWYPPTPSSGDPPSPPTETPPALPADPPHPSVGHPTPSTTTPPTASSKD